MEEIKLVHQSFEGCGSIYLGPVPNKHHIQLLNKFTIRAVLLLSPANFSLPHNYKILQIQPSEREQGLLRDQFTASYLFLDKERTRTNILISSSGGCEVGMSFLLGFIMKKYHYDLQYVSRLFGQQLREIQIPPAYQLQLQKISIEFEKEKIREEEEGQELNGTRIGRRIVRIRRQYNNLSHWSRFGSLPKNKQPAFNPEANSARKPQDEFVLELKTADKPRLMHQRRLSALE